MNVIRSYNQSRHAFRTKMHGHLTISKEQTILKGKQHVISIQMQMVNFYLSYLFCHACFKQDYRLYKSCENELSNSYWDSLFSMSYTFSLSKSSSSLGAFSMLFNCLLWWWSIYSWWFFLHKCHENLNF